MRNSNEIHENDGSANTRMRAKCPLWARIVLACGAVLLLLVAGVAAVNLSASITFNQATASLNANIKAAQDESADITTLKAQQQQTDAQFAETGRMRTLLLPQVKDAIDTNASISSELTKITLKQAEAQNRGSDSGQAQSAQQFFIQCQKGRRVDRRTEEAGRGADEGQSAIHRYPVEHHPVRAESDAEQGYRGYQAVVSSRSQLFFFLTPSRVMALSRLFPGFGCRLWHLSNFR